MTNTIVLFNLKTFEIFNTFFCFCQIFARLAVHYKNIIQFDRHLLRNEINISVNAVFLSDSFRLRDYLVFRHSTGAIVIERR